MWYSAFQVARKDTSRIIQFSKATIMCAILSQTNGLDAILGDRPQIKLVKFLAANRGKARKGKGKDSILQRVDIRLIMAAAIGSLLAGGCFGGIGMLLKSSAASQSILADAMARTDTTPVNDVRSHLITSGLNSTQSEMYGETYSAQPVTYKERPCLVKKEITLRVFKTHVWVQPVKRKEQGDANGVTTTPGHWRKEERSQVHCSRRATPTAV